MKKNIERKADLGFRFSDIISPEEQLVMRMTVSKKKYSFDKAQFEAGKKLYRVSGTPLNKAAERTMNTVARQTWFNPNTGKEISFLNVSKATTDVG